MVGTNPWRRSYRQPYERLLLCPRDPAFLHAPHLRERWLVLGLKKNLRILIFKELSYFTRHISAFATVLLDPFSSALGPQLELREPRRQCFVGQVALNRRSVCM